MVRRLYGAMGDGPAYGSRDAERGDRPTDALSASGRTGECGRPIRARDRLRSPPHGSVCFGRHQPTCGPAPPIAGRSVTGTDWTMAQPHGLLDQLGKASIRVAVNPAPIGGFARCAAA